MRKPEYFFVFSMEMFMALFFAFIGIKRTWFWFPAVSIPLAVLAIASFIVWLFPI